MVTVLNQYQVRDLAIPVFRIDEHGQEEILDCGYNPPVTEEDKESQKSEWYQVFDRVKSILSSEWTHGIENSDFFMPSDRERTRMLSVEISNARMLNAQVIRIVHSVLLDYPIDFCVDVCDSWSFLKSFDGKPFPHFNCFVERNRIMLYAESDAVLDCLDAVLST